MIRVDPRRAQEQRERLSQGGEGWGSWREYIAAFLPNHASRTAYDGSIFIWSTPGGVWNLNLGRPQDLGHPGSGPLCWRGTCAWDNAGVRWVFDDPDPEHIRAFLRLVGALDWDMSDDELYGGGMPGDA